MIEAQEGLTWPRWRRIATDVERLGFASLRTSDHCQSMFGIPERESVAAWPALALAAEWTGRIQLASMVSPITFYVPAVLGRTARAVDELSGGRLLLGVGAGWSAAEHQRFAIPFPGWRERFDALETGIHHMREVFSGPLLIGGGGERRTLPLAARHATEWNVMAGTADIFRAKSELLDQRCREIGRDPVEIRRSLMRGCLIASNRTELLDRVAALADVIPTLAGTNPERALTGLRQNLFAGTPEEVIAQMRSFAAAGVELFIIQHFLLDDTAALELLAREVMPALD